MSEPGKILLITISALFLSCNTSIKERNKNIKEKETDTISGKVFLKKDNTDNILFVNTSALIFFSVSEKEFRQFLHFTGKESEYEFKIIYKRFKKLVENTKKATQNKIKTVYSVNPEIAFITKSGDTLLFKRKEDDLFIGQIFFSGDSLKIIEGLLKRDSLEFYIKDFFNLKEDINIKPAIIQIDNQRVTKTDTVETAPKDTVGSP